MGLSVFYKEASVYHPLTVSISFKNIIINS